MRDRFTRAHDLAGRQFGLLTTAQASGIGFSTSATSRLVTDGRWRRLLPRVLKLWDVDDEWRQFVTATSLWAGDSGTISHRAAAAWWGFDGCGRGTIDVTLSSPRKSPHERVSIHRLPLRSNERARTGCMWITTPTRTILDIASCVTDLELEVALHGALRSGQTTVRRLRGLLDHHSRRHGRTRLSALLDDVSRNGITESPLEIRFLTAIRRAGLPAPQRQYRIYDGRRFVARVDFAYPKAKFAIEVDGLRFHSSRADLVRDHARLNALQTCGWSVLFLSLSDLDPPRRALAKIRNFSGQTLFRVDVPAERDSALRRGVEGDQ